MRYRFIAFDLDGTLLKSLTEVSEENYAALKTLYEMGVIMVPTTGRSLYEMPKEVRECPYFRYAITSGGACTYDLRTEEMIASSLLSKEEAEKLFNLLDEYDNVTMTHYRGYSYVDKTQSIEYYDKCRVTNAFKTFIPIFDDAVDDFGAYCRKMDGIELTCSFFSTDKDKEEFKARIKEAGSYTVVASAKDNLEVLSGSVDKGVAVLSLAGSLGIKREETVGVGDSINDLAMIKAVGLGIAMGNALDALKVEADAVGCNCKDHIARFILENYFNT